jgi:hypothetical protein
MTTIATDGKSMAGDGRCGGECLHCEVVKIARAKDGAILGCAGHAFDLGEFLKWHEEGGEIGVTEDFEGLILQPDGEVLCVDAKGRSFVHGVPAAVGSGCRFAYGAMDAGLFPEDAVRIAAKRDAFTSGTITVLHLGGAQA